MEVAFKIEDGVIAADAQVGQTNFKRHYPEVNRSILWEELLPYVEQATDLYVLPYVGATLYNTIVGAYQTGDISGWSAPKKRFLELLQRSVAYYTIYHALPKKLGVIASMGTVNETPSQGAMPQSQWSYKNQLWSVTKDADRFLDELTDFLQAQVNANNADFNSWKTSTAYTEGKADLFRSTQEFQSYHNISRSLRTFLTLIPYIKKAANKYLIPVLGNAQYQALITALKNNSATTDQKNLIEYVRCCLAEYSIMTAIPSMTCIIEADGVKVVSSTDGMDSKGSITSAFYKEAADKHQFAADENARTFRADLIDFLYKNADSFPDWKASEFYTESSTSGRAVIGGESGGVWL